ncbi:MAG: adenosylcobalamin-dependent ribonucleoside-diphosphate reductase [Sulfuricaulis sp.]
MQHNNVDVKSVGPELPEQEFSALTRGEKYTTAKDETLDQIRMRVARALAKAEPVERQEYWERMFFDAQNLGFVPAGRINSSAGTQRTTTLTNCFVEPVGDSCSSTVDGKPGIFVALQEAAETMRKGGGVGYDFTAIRPLGAYVKKTDSRASGPLSFMEMFDAMCKTVESAGARRGAQMGMLRCDHPDVVEFVKAKYRKDYLTQFNMSVSVTNDLLMAVEQDREFELVHKAEPGNEIKRNGAYRRDDGVWVYRKIKARELWDEIMKSTYDHGEPGVVFIDRMNEENNLWYCEKIEATNPCAEEPLPSYGCCCLGSINLTKFVRQPFSTNAYFDIEGFGRLVHTCVRMLDNVLTVTPWPLAAQSIESQNKRRIGLGFLGLGTSMVMLGIRYDSNPARELAAEISKVMRDESYRASVNLAREKGKFPLFDSERFLQGKFASRLPEDIRQGIREHGLRNSHLLAIAPTGTITLSFADNASNGIEPPYSWTYTRTKRLANGEKMDFQVEDHGFRLYKHMVDPNPYEETSEGRRLKVPPYFVSALEMSASDHMKMVAAVTPYIDASVSKTVNIPESYPFDDFKTLYMDAWRAGAKSLATFRPNSVLGAVLKVEPTLVAKNIVSDLDESDPDRRIRLKEVPTPPMASLRWYKRPKNPAGNPAWCYMVSHPYGYKFAVFIGHIENGNSHPFEVWVNGVEQPRGLGALAKSLSMDMRSNDRGWLKAKLESLSRADGDDGFDLPMPPDGNLVRVPSLVAGFARLLRHRCIELGALSIDGETPVLNALMSAKEPKTGTDGTMSWTVDILNPATEDDFVMGVKELDLPNGTRRPFSVWLSGEYPRVLDGLCKSLSFDMRVVDPAWVGGKLRQLLDYAEPQGDFLARSPSSKKQENYPSTVAYMARLLIHRYAMLGVLDEEGYPIESMGVVEHYDADNIVPIKVRTANAGKVLPGKICRECKSHAVIRKDGCDYCTACGATGSCG